MIGSDNSNGMSPTTEQRAILNVLLVTVSGTAPVFNHDTNEYVVISTAPICANWAVSTSEDMQNTVSTGTAYTSSDIDYTIKACQA